MAFRSSRKSLLGYKTGKDPGRRFISQKSKERIYNCKVTKINAPSKREVTGGPKFRKKPA